MCFAPVRFGFAALRAEFDGLRLGRVGRDDATAHEARIGVGKLALTGLVVARREADEAIGDGNLIDLERGFVQFADSALLLGLGKRSYLRLGALLDATVRQGATNAQQQHCRNEQLASEHATFDWKVGLCVPIPRFRE